MRGGRKIPLCRLRSGKSDPLAVVGARSVAHNSFCLRAVALVLLLSSQTGLARTPLDRIPWGASLETSLGALAPLCMADRLFTQHPVVSPLAEVREQHYLCLGYRHEDGIVDKVVFVFADDALVQVEARGNAVRAFAPLRSPIERYFEYHVLDDGKGYASDSEDAVWFMSPAARRSGLIPLSNPYLAGKSTAKIYGEGVQVPAAVSFGVSMAQALPALRQACPLLEVKRNRIAPDSAALLSCLGYEFAGFPRLVDFSFEAGRLARIRVSIGDGEKQRLRDALRNAYGEPDAHDQVYQSYADGLVVLDHSGSQVLLLSREHAASR